MSRNTFGRYAFPIVALAVLAACSGGGTPPVGSSNLTSSAQIAPASAIMDMSKCKSDNDVSVHPCSVKLSVTNPTANVTAKGPAKGTFKVNDMKCETNLIATVTGSGKDYVVTAGTASGKCTAKFEDKDENGKRIGTATLSIQNNA